MPDSLGFAMQRALPRSGRERELQQTQALVSQRAAELTLDKRLTLGLSVDAIEEYIAALPADVVEQCNENRPINGVRVPANAALNGYVNQWQVARRSESDGGKAYCETLYERGNPGVGVATVFVSWFLETPLATLVDALRLHPELPPDTKFWVCDFVIRQSTRSLDVTMNDVKRLGDCEQQAAFEEALVWDFDSIAKKLSEVDVRKAECRNPRDTEQILGELEREVGLTECNKAVFGLLRGALAGQGRAALERMEPAERATSTLTNQLGMLLYEQGDLDGAEALEGRRETLGDRHRFHRSTLSSINSLGGLRREKGDLDGAEALYREAHDGRRETLGDRHRDTLTATNNLGALQQAKGDLDGAETLCREALEGCRETLGDRHPDTLGSISSLGGLLYAKGDLDGAGPLRWRGGGRETLGDRHPDTLTMINNLGNLLRAKGDLDGAEALLREAMEAQRETLGDRHPKTLTSINRRSIPRSTTSAGCCTLGALEGCRETLGDKHPDTLLSISNLGQLLKAKGDLDGAEAFCREALEGRPETLGDRHPKTLTSLYNLGMLLQKQGRLGDAIPLFREELDGGEIGAPVPALPYRQFKKKLKILRMGASGFLAEGGGSVPRSGDIDLAFWSFVSGWLARLDRQWKTAVRTVLTLRGEDDPALSERAQALHAWAELTRTGVRKIVKKVNKLKGEGDLRLRPVLDYAFTRGFLRSQLEMIFSTDKRPSCPVCLEERAFHRHRCRYRSLFLAQPSTRPASPPSRQQSAGTPCARLALPASQERRRRRRRRFGARSVGAVCGHRPSRSPRPRVARPGCCRRPRRPEARLERRRSLLCLMLRRAYVLAQSCRFRNRQRGRGLGGRGRGMSPPSIVRS
ncbi:hypothetical protein EMIHUDRAFT_464982 [Emiliania huxleyi CCMP1516]|uniref:Uncharacterized protein n=2 Tax=Emiliania huxleyi TaxID=2903 RepID=A0A0D3IKZ5_EMIH1|nr:hypothetical protein EMIHUDRAFT_464982 [Emiliania huxleyi CCMP1516]EOD11930.1 hypothetical protein EMIHUDRAFT_464982 [Emiliania huxleyi CCMP1516]|eukprot:XP_005764359.1 hypothetical protein EMIHUDRAFT_464982 [Emiliania huxleyi CCMP1516]